MGAAILAAAATRCYDLSGLVNSFISTRLPLLVALVAVACASPAPVPATPVGVGAQATATYPGGARPGNLAAGPVSPETGKALFTAKGCVACHKVTGVPGAVGEVGPALDGVADVAKRPKIADGRLDNSPENMKRWVVNPPAIKPGTQMPNLNLASREADSLVAFLQTLK